MIEALIGRDGRRVDAAVGRDRRDEDVGPAELQIDARLALLRGADHLGTEHAFVIPRGRLRVGAPQMDVVIGEVGHRVPPGRSASVPVPTFVSSCRTDVYERRNQRDTSTSMILVRLLDLTFL